MTSPDLIIFDCDGVLIDSETLALQAMVETLLSVHGLKISLQEATKRFVGKNEITNLADIKQHNGVDVSVDCLTEIGKRRTQLYEQNLKPIPGIFELIDALPFKKCVASSTSLEGLQHTLEMTHLWECFAPYIFSAEQVKVGKPAPDLFLFAAEQMGVLPSDCLVIEDSIAGVRAAKAAEMRVFGFTGGSHCGAEHAEVLRREGAERIFSEIKEIAEALL